MNQPNGMCEREILDDILSSQKMITGLYNTSANECCRPRHPGRILKHPERGASGAGRGL